MTDGNGQTECSDESRMALEDAMDWLLRLQSADRDPEVRSEFERWIARSRGNRDAWMRASRSWDVLGKVPPIHAHRWSDRRQRRKPLGRRRPIAAAGIAAAIAACLILFLQPRIGIWLHADHVAAVGETKQVLLGDGSRVLLNSGSAIAVHYGSGARSVTLLKGEAFFDVRPNTSVPFTVETAEMSVTVVGTAFDVRLTEAGGTVGVSEGEVRVNVAGERAGTAARLRPGDFLSYDRTTGHTQVSNVSTDRFAAWHEGRLFLNDVTVAEAVEELERYYSGLILLPDTAFAARRVTGLYDIRDPERALHALAAPLGGVLRKPVPGVLLLTGR